MSESTPIFDPPTIPEGSPAVQSEGAASIASIHSGQNGINGQDITMGGQEDSSNKTIKPNDNSALSLNNPATPTTTTTNNTSTTMVGRSFVSDAATAGNSRAASADRTGDRVAMPTMAATHGAPTRQYLNSKVTYHVMEGMKIVAKERPADPLRVLGEFLLKRSQEIEGTDANGSAATAPGDETKEADKNGDEQ